MRFLLDESADARLVRHLASPGHDVTRVATDHPSGIPDTEVLAIGHARRRAIITEDRDFSELVFRLMHPHAGVIRSR